MPAEEVAVLTPDLADAMIALVTKNPPPPATNTFFDYSNCILAYTTDGATARSGTTLGVGTATIWNIKPDNTIEATGVDPVEFVNLFQTPVGAGKYIALQRISGKLVCVLEEC